MTGTAPSASPAERTDRPGAPRRRVKVWDVVLSIVLVAFGGAGWVIGVFIDNVVTTFMAGDCNDPICDPGQNFDLQTSFVVSGALIGLGLVIAVVRFVLRRVAWPYPLGAAILSAAVLAFGVLGFQSGLEP